MKILKAPTKSAWSLKFTCGSCKAELEAGIADVKNTGYEMSDYYHVAYGVSCPLCGEKIELSSSEMDSYLKAKLLANAHKNSSAIKSKQGGTNEGT